MFNQFRVRYPQGCLITELLTINNGKYIVKASVLVGGDTLATGMAAAETVELAEDQARIRALAVLEISPSSASASEPSPIASEVSKPPVSLPNTFTTQIASPLESKVQTDQSSVFLETSASNNGESTMSVSELNLPHTAANTKAFREESVFPLSEQFESNGEVAPEQDNYADFPVSPEITAKSVVNEAKSKTKRNTSEEKPSSAKVPTIETEFSPSEPPTNTGKASSSAPVDLSEFITGTTREMKRLGWTNQQGRDYLVRTYNKKTRADLTPEELVEFFNYLEELPSPED